MGMSRQIKQYATRRATRKLTRAVPWLGAVVALLTVAGTIRRKGLFGGALDTALDFTPVVGTLKNMAEVGTRPRLHQRQAASRVEPLLYRRLSDRDRREPFHLTRDDFHLGKGRELVRAEHALDTASLKLLRAQRRDDDKFKRV